MLENYSRHIKGRHTHNRSFAVFAILLAACILSPLAMSQKGDEPLDERYEDWFQVEIIIFARSSSSSPDQEQWPKNVALAYPPKLQFLIDPNAISEDKDIATDDESEAKVARPNYVEAADLNNPKKMPLPEMETPFVILDKSERILEAQAYEFKRARGKRLLFHEAWRQPMVSLDSSPAIVVIAGEQFDKNNELEGTVTISLSRYLHIHTNLWLTQFEANYGQETAHWPYPPEQPKPFVLSDEELNRDFELNSETKTNNWNFSLDNTDTTNDFNFDEPTDSSLYSEYTNITQQPFVVKEVVTMQQKRRMRSTELHYLDHPKLGILIQIDKYQPTLPKNIK